MDARADSFLDDFSPLSQSLVGAKSDRREQAVSASGFFITVENEECFRCFDSALDEGHGNVGIWFALDEIRGKETFRNVCLLAHDNSSSMSAAEIKNKFFFDSVDNIKIVWDYCILSKLEAQSSSEIMDESDEMQLEIFKQLESFYSQHKTLPPHMDQDIMDLFRYYCARDVILEASKHLAHSNEDMLVDSEKDENEDMDTEIMVQGNDFDTLSGCEIFYQKFNGRAGK